MAVVNGLSYLVRMSLSVGLLTLYILLMTLAVNYLLVIITLPLAVLTQFVYSRSQRCHRCGKGVYANNSNVLAYIWGILYFPLSCPHCQTNLCANQEQNLLISKSQQS